MDTNGTNIIFFSNVSLARLTAGNAPLPQPNSWLHAIQRLWHSKSKDSEIDYIDILLVIIFIDFYWLLDKIQGYAYLSFLALWQ